MIVGHAVSSDCTHLDTSHHDSQQPVLRRYPGSGERQVEHLVPEESLVGLGELGRLLVGQRQVDTLPRARPREITRAAAEQLTNLREFSRYFNRREQPGATRSHFLQKKIKNYLVHSKNVT